MAEDSKKNLWIIRKSVWIIRSREMSVVEPQSLSKRSEKSCRLTVEGLKTLKSAIGQLDKKQQSHSYLAAACSCDRGTISKIRNRRGGAVFGKIFQLFSFLGLDLEETHWEEWQGEANGLRPSKAGEQQPKQAQLLHLLTRAQQVAHLLWTLNCDDQEGCFKSQCKQTQQAHLFVVQAPDQRIQKWLVKRFMRQYHNAQPYPLNIRGLGISADFSKFWQEFETRLKLTNASTETILQALCEQAQTKPVFIAVFGLHRFQETRHKVLTEFWVPLSQKFGAQAARLVKSKLVLFLIEEPQSDLFDSFQDACRLSPLNELSGTEIAAWIQLKDVYEMLSQTRGEESLERMVASELPHWQTHPVLALDDVCYAFGLKEGIADVEPYWELTG